MINDYNGPGDWSASGVRERYSEAARRTGQEQVRDLQPREHTHYGQHYIYPVIEQVIAGVREGDPACIEVAVQFVESSHKQASGRVLHANAARALRRAPLNAHQVGRLRQRFYGMLIRREVPHEFSEYAKLLRRIGLDGDWPATRVLVDESNQYVMRFVRYLDRHASVGA